MGKDVKIPAKMFFDLDYLIMRLKEYELDDELRKVCISIEGQIIAKYQATERRVAFGESKTGPTEEIREAAKQRYLEAKARHRGY
ncbi:MAG: hypothetical protein FWC93_03525 [Defluviitaleaceae bacterium]|nr:hypothetical protein [Defluviitaleaceae bacterium]